jgi:hypothetical protein
MSTGQSTTSVNAASFAAANARATPAASSDVPLQLTHPLIDFFVAETGALGVVVTVLAVPGVVAPDGAVPELVVVVPELVVPGDVVPELVVVGAVAPEVVVPGDVVLELAVLDVAVPVLVLAGPAAAVLLEELLDVLHPTIGRASIDDAINEPTALFIGCELWQFGLR